MKLTPAENTELVQQICAHGHNLAAATIKHPAVKKLIEKILPELQNGKSLGEAIQEHPCVSLIVRRTVLFGEKAKSKIPLQAILMTLEDEIVLHKKRNLSILAVITTGILLLVGYKILRKNGCCKR